MRATQSVAKRQSQATNLTFARSLANIMLSGICEMLAVFFASSALAFLGHSALAETVGPPLTSAEGKSLAVAVMHNLRISDARFIIKSFEDIARDPATVKPTSPIEIVVGDSRTSPVAGVYSNCVADAMQRLIQCDLRVLDDIIDDWSLLYLEKDRNSYREFLLRLILAHELGHVWLRHPSAAYHSASEGFSVLKYAQHRLELAADSYAISLVEQSKYDLDGTYAGIVHLAYQAMKKSLCPETFPNLCPCPGYANPMLCSSVAAGPGLPLSGTESFNIVLAGTHPEFLVRFARMLDLARYQKARTYYAKSAREILRRIVIKNETGEPERLEALFR